MKNESPCPDCGNLVSDELPSCPGCGTDLEPTVNMPGRRPEPLGLELVPGQNFAERFTIIERLGQGGMGVVYKAVDNTLGCAVALKLILPELKERRNLVERFRREVRITRQITHPNICRVHDIGEDAGVFFISMEWIDGETLRDLLHKTGTLREGRALQLAARMARGLEAAHEQKVIHRDLKPANVMVDRLGNVRLLDFGLAREQGAPDLTQEGAVVGTPMYMAPEQKVGLPMDARTDLYALGLILREMLLGKLPPSGSAVNPLIQPVLDRLTAENPADRYATAGEARQALEQLEEDPAISRVSSGILLGVAPRVMRRRLIVGTAALVLVLAGAIWFLFVREPAAMMDPRAQVFFDRGLHYLEEVESTESLDDAIQMFHRAENFDPDSAYITARLSVAYWLRFRNTHTAASREEAERYIGKTHLIDPEFPELAYARALGLFTEGKYDAARTQLERAVAGRPELANAWAYLGATYKNLGQYEEGLRALDQAMELEPGSYRMLIFRGSFHQHFGEHDVALDYYRRATELKPDSRVAWTNLGGALLFTGRFEEAIPAFSRSIEIEDNAEARTNLGTSLYFLGRYEESLEHYLAATSLQPDQAVNWGNLGDAYLELGRIPEAREVYARAAEVARQRVDAEQLSPDALQKLALYCAKAGDAACAQDSVAMLIELQPDNATAVLTRAVVDCVLGRYDESLNWLKQAVDLGASKAQIQASPELAALEQFERYRKILELAS